MTNFFHSRRGDKGWMAHFRFMDGWIFNGIGLNASKLFKRRIR